MKFRVRNRDGELEIPSLGELVRLCRCGFVADDDEVCRGDSKRWVKAGDIPELRSAREKRRSKGLEFAWVALAVCIGSLILVLVMGR